MGRIGIYGILSVVLFGLIGCAPGKSDKEESVRLYKEAIVLLGSDSVTIDDCLAAQRLLEQALDADSENIDVYFGKVLNELNLWRPDSAYRTASAAIEKIGETGKNRELFNGGSGEYGLSVEQIGLAIGIGGETNGFGLYCKVAFERGG